MSRMSSKGPEKRQAINAELAERDGASCFYCGTAFAVDLADATFDHLVPYARFPRNLRVNLVLACYPCNQTKGDQQPHDFLRISAADLAARVGSSTATVERVLAAPAQASDRIRKRVLAALLQYGRARPLPQIAASVAA